MNTNHPGLSAWRTLGETGTSSKALASYLAGGWLPPGFNDPADPGDFRRCELLLRAVPTLRPLLPKMAEVSPRWAGLVEQWDNIVALMEKEVPESFTGRVPYGATAPKSYALIRSITGPTLAQDDNADQPPGVDVHDSSRQLPPAKAAGERVREFVSHFGDGEIFPEFGTRPALYARDLEALAKAALNVSEG